MGTSEQRVLHFTGKRRITAGRIRRQFRLLGTESTASPEEDPETDASMSPMDLGQELRERQPSTRQAEDSNRTAHSRQRSGPEEGEDEAGGGECLRLHCSPRSREKSLASSPRGETGHVQQYGSRPQVWNAAQLCSCAAPVFPLARHLASSSVHVFGGASARLL